MQKAPSEPFTSCLPLSRPLLSPACPRDILTALWMRNYWSIASMLSCASMPMGTLCLDSPWSAAP